MAEAPEQRELNLIGKVELRIALADTDAKLQSTLQTYLPPLLLKLASESKSVRNKVLSVCQHISTRIKASSIQLPVDALLKQYKTANNLLVRRFDLLYVQQGVDRLPVQVSPVWYYVRSTETHQQVVCKVFYFRAFQVFVQWHCVFALDSRPSPSVRSGASIPWHLLKSTVDEIVVD